MALLDDSVPLQRDDEAPHVGVDVGVGATGAVAQTPGVATPTPFQLQMTILYRGLNGWASADGNWEVLHEPSIQFVGDSALPMAPVSIQESITLINTHWMPLWQKGDRSRTVDVRAAANRPQVDRFGGRSAPGGAAHYPDIQHHRHADRHVHRTRVRRDHCLDVVDRWCRSDDSPR
jgi:hypothetical protein